MYFFSSKSDQESSLPPAPESLLANQLPQSLLASNSSSSTFAMPPRPRTPWAVKDHSLKHIPKYYPPMDPNCTAFVPGTTASVVAFRIAECLRQHSVAAEYDNESVSFSDAMMKLCIVEPFLSDLFLIFYYFRLLPMP